MRKRSETTHAAAAVATVLLLCAPHAVAHSGAHRFTPAAPITPFANLGESLDARLTRHLKAVVYASHAHSKATGRTMRLIGVTATPGFGTSRVEIDLSRDVLALGLGSQDFEDFIHALHHAAHDAIDGRLKNVEYAILIEGEPLAAHFGFEQALTAQTLTQTAPKTGSKSAEGRRVTISPGHGYYLSAGRWQLQRSYYFGIVEDFINTEFVANLNNQLLSIGAIVRPARELNKSAGNGESGFAKWQEASRYFVKARGVPESVWNSLASDDDLSDDIRVRPLYANWRDADGNATELIVSIHNNGGGGTGTETWYDTQNGFQVESRRLADIVHNRIIAAIRGGFAANWPDRGVKGSAGGYGENRLATRPAILVEVAFMDTKADNDAMQAERFRDIVAGAIRDGVAQYLATKIDLTSPTAPEAPMARVVGARQIDLTWRPASDDVGVTAYRVLRDGVEVGATTARRFTDANLAPSTTYTYTVAARDAAGNWGPPTQAITAATTAPTPYMGLWWNAGESGWGMSLTQHSNRLFAAIYAFDGGGNPEWLVIPDCPVTHSACTGEIYRVTGGTAPTTRWDGAAVKPMSVGRATLTFGDANSLWLDAQINGQTAAKAMTRNVFGPLAASPVVDYTDLWWVENESGWGIAFTQQGSSLFASWYVYADDGKPVWYVAPECRIDGQRCASDLYAVSGGSALTSQWTAEALKVNKVGDVALTWADASSAVMTFAINGKTGSRSIVRNGF